MLDLKDIQDLVADTFMGGSAELAGIAMFLLSIVLVFGLLRNAFMALLVGMGVAMFFTAFGVLPTELAILMIIVSVLGLAYTSRQTWS